MRVRKAIIPAAGLGTRFLPATKAQPKEMLPIVDKPTIQYIVEEAVASGIEDILIISGRGKRAIEDHFDKSYELEETLEKKNKNKELENIKKISHLANIHYIRQKEPRGLGDAINCARTFIGNEPFAVMLGDDIVQADVPCVKQLMNIYDIHQVPVVGVQQVRDEDVEKYGIVSIEDELDEGLFSVGTFVEKPNVDDAPSNFAIMGRYILTPDIFNILPKLSAGAGGEIQLTDALLQLNEERPIFAYEFEGNRYDVGDKLGFVKATIDFALMRNDIRGNLLDYFQMKLDESKLRKR
ncbi:MAG: UTP--glucose-phosphate uridylyltransferase [Bacillales bacterium]|nr:UTP--glucose-phosphate uridylyltransferase [Bacillales bacterium]